MTSVEVQSPPPPSPDTTAEGESQEAATSSPVEGEGAPASTYEWLASVPVLSSAGSTVYGWYEGSKNYTRASKYALDSVETSVKYVAGTAASVVKGPMTAVDSFAVKQLVKLEEKVPVIKTDTGEVLEALDEQKKAVYTRITSGKEAITTRITSGKDALVEAVANSGPAHLVSGGVNRTLEATENIVNYLLPEKPEDEPTTAGSEGEKTQLKVSEEAEDSSDDEEEEEGEEGEEAKGDEGKAETNTERVKNISRKVKVRVYYRTLRRLDTVQEQCKTTLEHLKTNIDLLKMAHGAYEEMDKQYKHLQSSLRSIRGHLGSLVPTSSSSAQDPVVTLLDDSEEGEVQLESMTPEEKATVFQGVLDYARQLSEKVYTTFQSVSSATSFLPHNLKSGANHALQVSQELYTTLKSAKVPTDIPASVLNKTSEVIDAQLGYVKQLGTFIKTSLKAKEKNESTDPGEQKTLLVPDEAKEDGSDSDEGEPPISRPPGEEGEPPISGPPGGEEEEATLGSGDEK